MRRHSPRRPGRPRLGSGAKLGNFDHAALRCHIHVRPDALVWAAERNSAILSTPPCAATAQVGPDALVWAAERTRQSEHAPCVATAHVGPDALVWAAEQ